MLIGQKPVQRREIGEKCVFFSLLGAVKKSFLIASLQWLSAVYILKRRFVKSLRI